MEPLEGVPGRVKWTVLGRKLWHGKHCQRLGTTAGWILIMTGEVICGLSVLAGSRAEGRDEDQCVMPRGLVHEHCKIG